MNDDAAIFQAHRPALLTLAYRMLGGMARAEDMVQDAWIRWHHRQTVVETPRAFLLTTVARLCLDELDSARARHEESRGDRLPEPVDLAASGIDWVDSWGEISMAFLVLLQRLTPAERAVFLLHEVLEMGHREIAALLGKNEDASRQLLRRAKEHVAVDKRELPASRDEHHRLLGMFVGAVTRGEQAQLVAMLTEDAVLVVDGGRDGTRYGRIRSVGHPVVGPTKIAALLRTFAEQETTAELLYREATLNGDSAVIALHQGRPLAAISIATANGHVSRVFVQLDTARLGHLGLDGKR